MPLTHEPSKPHQSVQDALRVLETISRHGTGAAPADVERDTGLRPDRLAALLEMLRTEGYVECLSDGGYVTGETLSLLGSSLNSECAIKTHLQRTLARLRDSIGAAVYIGRYVDGEITLTGVADGPDSPRVNEWVDFRTTGHASAMGKSLLSQLDANSRRDHLSRHRPARFTSRTITDEQVLFRKLDAQAPTVPVLDVQEYAVGTVCAAVPITAGSSVGCLALSLPVEHAHRLYQAADTLNRGATPVLLSLAI